MCVAGEEGLPGEMSMVEEELGKKFSLMRTSKDRF